MKKIIVPVVLLVIGFGSYFALAEQQEPEVISYIKQQGVTIIDSFETPAGLTGYAASVEGQPLSIYLTEDKKYAVIGNLINAQGDDLGQEALYELVSAPQNEKIWQQLDTAKWVLDGDKDAKRIIYTFTDPYCPYCQKLREIADPYIAKGEVQLRHIMVGILQEDSIKKAAAILGADSPEKALQQHIQPADNPTENINEEALANGSLLVEENNLLMEQLGFMATPTSIYKDEKGHVRLIEGMPMRDDIDKLFEQ
ncbi:MULTISPECIES: thiol:disulfide interchange protein DsbG [unclassified Methylophaga]|jgi:thiol:disulfide interchange protein DsbG|uniref:Thiol:disulfide interchange protein n=1 Tax=Pseudidiomarina aestuarii TaxID=624146 RepID=A0A2T4CZD1_9GAMM|nr:MULTISPECIES: thiol:disulfide interchange protein DsbG [unclassified Methylophaga]PTB86899.1 thiol:disulfide interchange protein DsbG [Pseudidiomarina aestuarii]MAL49890.1 thiol:disulfide interchange protein DsbG [Methylophaga sp.]MAP26376.1 thiol:disulfide interchange protein DsbG [Methylophaga sp.]MBP24765.1 thiol:disulfide interchange protein DsbG [Methylophaga sp.]HAD31669.1 thiol:disulfide interchange protein DsbG [Methylophaga sp.]|tara:strand:- start:989 stop:1750 length:762 start_codon:yes stop_codon:yes gene_type:complete